MYGVELKCGDNICFTLSMRIDTKPLVKATITGFIYGKKPDNLGRYTDWIQVEYVDAPHAPDVQGTVEWAQREGKLVKKVIPYRVIKCY